MSGPISRLFGNYTKVWDDYFGEKAQRINLFTRGFLLVMPILFFGALAFIVSNEIIHNPVENCHVDGKGQNIKEKSGYVQISINLSFT